MKMLPILAEQRVDAQGELKHRFKHIKKNRSRLRDLVTVSSETALAQTSQREIGDE
jgi:hypothetical protein